MKATSKLKMLTWEVLIMVLCFLTSLILFTASNVDSVVPESEKLFMEGRIVQKLECRPYADTCYMKLKAESIRKASVPIRQVQQLDRIVHNFKPVSDHKHNVSETNFEACYFYAVCGNTGFYLRGNKNQTY